MKKIIDLTQKIYNKMPVHPFDGEVSVIQNKFIEKDKYNNTRISLGMHAGTHIDAPRHLIKDGKGLDAYELKHFIGKGCLVDVRGEKTISMKDEYIDKFRENDIVLLYTGHGDDFKKVEYYGEDMPIISKEFAKYLAQCKVKMVGMDLPSPDKYPFEVHKILLNGDVLIIENLVNLDKLISIKNFIVFALPLYIDAEASITRAVAVIE